MIRILIDRLHSLENKRYISAAGLSTDEKPLENLITGSVFSEIDTGKLYKFDEAGNAWIEASGGMTGGRVTALEGSALAQGTVIDAVGIPAYVSDVAAYTAYGITDTGWYVFARIDAPEGVPQKGGEKRQWMTRHCRSFGITFGSIWTSLMNWQR